MIIQLIDLKINNLSSMVRAIEGMDPRFQIEIISDTKSHFVKPDLMIIPGVGNFGAAMEAIRKNDLEVYIKEQNQSGVKLVGICLGMQLLLTGSEESPEVLGLGLIPGIARQLSKSDDRVPNVGWNNLSYDATIYKRYELSPEASFYFTHSFYADVPQQFVLASSNHGKRTFPAVISNTTAVGIQFHPEKSGSDGKRFLRRVIESQFH